MTEATELDRRVIILIQPEADVVDRVDEADLPLYVAKSPLDASYALEKFPRHVLAYGLDTLGLAVTGRLLPIETEHPRLVLLMREPAGPAAREQGTLIRQAAHKLDAYPVLFAHSPAAMQVLMLLAQGHEWQQIKESLEQFNEHLRMRAADEANERDPGGGE